MSYEHAGYLENSNLRCKNRSKMCRSNVICSIVLSTLCIIPLKVLNFPGANGISDFISSMSVKDALSKKK